MKKDVHKKLEPKIKEDKKLKIKSINKNSTKPVEQVKQNQNNEDVKNNTKDNILPEEKRISDNLTRSQKKKRKGGKIKIFVRKSLNCENGEKNNDEKSKKKELKTEENLSNYSVEFSEVIKENGIFKKNDDDIHKLIQESILNEEERKKREGEDEKDKKENEKDKKNEKKDEDDDDEEKKKIGEKYDEDDENKKNSEKENDENKNKQNIKK